MRMIFIAAITALALVAAPASAKSVETVAKAVRQTHCVHKEPESLIGPKNSGVTCRVRGHGELYILRYKSKAKALRFWRMWLSDGQVIAYSGSVFLIPAGPGDWYKPAAAKWAAKRTHGRTLAG